MVKDPYTTTPQVPIVEVLKIMKKESIKMVPVVKNGELLGVISEKNFINLSKSLLHKGGEK